MGSSSQNQTTNNSNTNANTNANTNYSGTTGSSTANSSTASSAPGWAPQVAALTDAYNQAPGALANAQSVAGPNSTSADLTGNGALSNNGLNLSNSGTAGANSAITGLQGYDPTKQNNTSSIIDSANQYVAGQNIDGQVNDAMLNAKQQARDVTLPGIQQNASIGGNTDSSRNGIAQGLVERGLAEQSANLGSTLRNAAYGQGLQLAQQQAQNNNTGTLSALQSLGLVGTQDASAGSNIYSGALNNTGTANNINQGNYTNSVGNAYAALQPYMNLFGSTNWGSTNTASNNGTTAGTNSGNQQSLSQLLSQTAGNGTSNTQNNPGLLSNISSGIGILGALL
jgi:hypothetical protein